MDLTPLQQEFLYDHRSLMADLKRIIAAVRRDDLKTAIREASEFDRAAGAHMAYEEEVFYPQLARTYGDDFVERLISEHVTAHSAVQALLNRSEEPLADGDREQLLSGLQLALDHMIRGGATFHELASGKADIDAENLDRLHQLRDRAENWTSRSYESRDAQPNGSGTVGPE